MRHTSISPLPVDAILCHLRMPGTIDAVTLKHNTLPVMTFM